MNVCQRQCRVGFTDERQIIRQPLIIQGTRAGDGRAERCARSRQHTHAGGIFHDGRRDRHLAFARATGGVKTRDVAELKIIQRAVVDRYLVNQPRKITAVRRRPADFHRMRRLRLAQIRIRIQSVNIAVGISIHISDQENSVVINHRDVIPESRLERGVAFERIGRAVEVDLRTQFLAGADGERPIRRRTIIRRAHENCRAVRANGRVQFDPRLDRELAVNLEQRRRRNLHIIGNAIEAERRADASGREARAVHQHAVVAADFIERVALAAPPTDQVGRRRAANRQIHHQQRV